MKKTRSTGGSQTFRPVCHCLHGNGYSNRLRKHVPLSRAYAGIQRRAVDVVPPSEVESY